MKKIPTEIYSRVVGYFRPLSNWNKGMQSQFDDRKTFSLERIKGRLDDEESKKCLK